MYSKLMRVSFLAATAGGLSYGSFQVYQSQKRLFEEIDYNIGNMEYHSSEMNHPVPLQTLENNRWVCPYLMNKYLTRSMPRYRFCLGLFDSSIYAQQTLVDQNYDRTSGQFQISVQTPCSNSNCVQTLTINYKDKMMNFNSVSTKL